MAVESNGTVLFYNSLTANTFWSITDTFPALNGFGEFISNNGNGDLRYRSSGTSPINYELTGPVGSRIAKVEWKNSGFYNNGPTYNDSINFQVWIYETSGDIEYRYGTGSVTAASYGGGTGPTVGISLYSADPTYDFISGTYLTGATTNPTVGVNYGQVTGTPANGTVYRFATTATGITTVANNNSLLSVYPNPASNVVTLNFTPTGIAVFSLSDITGRVIHNEEIKANGAVNKSFNVSELPAGVYYVTIKDEVSVATRKLVVK